MRDKGGIETLYEEALTEAYLLGNVSRETVLEELGPERLASIEYQRDAFRRDVEWGLKPPPGDQSPG